MLIEYLLGYNKGILEIDHVIKYYIIGSFFLIVFMTFI